MKCPPPLILFLTIAIVFLILLTSVVGYHSTGSGSDPAAASASSLSELLDAYSGNLSVKSDCGESSSTRPTYDFPEDFYPHQSAPTEVWNLMALLKSRDGRQFGVRWRLARVAINDCNIALPDSTWSFRDVMAIDARLYDLSELKENTTLEFSRISHQLAGASSNAVWVNEWRLETLRVATCGLSLRASAIQKQMRLLMNFDSSQCPIAADGDGTSTSSQRGFMVTGLDANATMTLNDQSMELTGSAWLQRGWGRFSSADSPVAWDQISLSVVNAGTRKIINLLRSRRRDGSGTPITTGLLVHEDGRTVALTSDDLQLESVVKKRWLRSTKRSWSLVVPSLNIDVALEPLLPVVADADDSGRLMNWSGIVSVTTQNSISYGFIDLGN